MRPVEVLNRSFSVRMVAMTVLIIVVGALVSAAFFYVNIDRDLGETYHQKLATLSLYKFEVMKQSFFIFAGFAILAFFGVAIFGILHTHKVVGPLVRTRVIAKEFAGGNFNVPVKFREGDAIQPVAESLDRFAKVYGGKYAQINDSVHEMQSEARELRELILKGDVEGAAAKRKKIADEVEKLNRALGGVKV